MFRTEKFRVRSSVLIDKIKKQGNPIVYSVLRLPQAQKFMARKNMMAIRGYLDILNLMFCTNIDKGLDLNHILKVLQFQKSRERVGIAFPKIDYYLDYSKADKMRSSKIPAII